MNRLILIIFVSLTLSGCLGTLEETLEQAEADAQGETYNREVLAEEIPPLEAPPNIRASLPASLARLGFPTISGVPAQTEQRLSESLRQAAFRRNIFLVPNGDRAQTHIVKGYLSLTQSELGTIVVYVWDISANNSTSPHRVTGQILVPDAGANWSSLNQNVLDKLAVQTMEALITWLNSQFAEQPDTRDIVPFR